MRKAGNERRREATADAELWKWLRPDGTIERLPRTRAMRARLLAHVADRFVEGRTYTEREVNAVLAPLTDDVAALRRYLIDGGCLVRSSGEYRRP